MLDLFRDSSYAHVILRDTMLGPTASPRMETS